MDEDVAMALLNGGVIAADVLAEDLNVVLGKAADGREQPRQREARGLVAGGWVSSCPRQAVRVHV